MQCTQSCACRFSERKLLVAELPDVLKISGEAINESVDNSGCCSRPDSLNRSTSLSESSATLSTPAGIAGSPLVNFHIIVEEKLQVHVRRRYEKQVSLNIFVLYFITSLKLIFCLDLPTP